MDILTLMQFSKLLEMKFLEWQQLEGGRKTVKEFAEWLGFGQSTVSNWMNETRVPQSEAVHQLALKLGLEVYDSLGLERPNENLFYIQRVFEILPDEAQQSIRDDVERYFTTNQNVDAQSQKAHRDDNPALALPDEEPASRDRK